MLAPAVDPVLSRWYGAGGRTGIGIATKNPDTEAPSTLIRAGFLIRKSPRKEVVLRAAMRMT